MDRRIQSREVVTTGNGCYTLKVCVPQNSYVEAALTSGVAAFGDGASKEVMKVK